MTFKREGTAFETVAVDSTGHASIVVDGLAVGVHAFTAEFSGNTEVGAAVSAILYQHVTTDTTQTILDTPDTPPVYGTDWPVGVVVAGSFYTGSDWVVLTVDGVDTEFYSSQPLNLRLTPGPHTIVARFEGDAQAHSLAFSVNGPAGMTGALQLFEGDTLLASGPVDGTGAANLQATLTRGSHSVRAIYSGDANFNGVTLDLTLHVVPDTSLWIDARALASNVQIVHVLPAGASVSQLYRREGAGAWAPVSFDPNSGIDPAVLQRGVVYEYYLVVTLSGGGNQSSNTDGALLFTDDPLVTQSTTVKRAHFTEARDAINLMRTAAGLPAFDFDAAFTSDSIVRASHMTGLRTAVAEARSALGMTAATFTQAISVGTVVRATDIEELRNASR